MNILIGILVVILAIAIGFIFVSIQAKPVGCADLETLLINEAQGDSSLKYFGIAMALLMLDAALAFIAFLSWTLGWLDF